MPDPVYIICSQSGTEDTATKLVSVFNVLEKIQVAKLDVSDASHHILKPMPIRVTAAWTRRGDESPDQVFDFQIVFTFPPPGSEQLMGSGTFQFGAKELSRLIAVGELVYFSGPGILRVVCRARKQNSAGPWDEQSYPVFIEEVIPTVAGK